MALIHPAGCWARLRGRTWDDLADQERRFMKRSLLFSVALPVALAFAFTTLNTFLWILILWLFWFVLPIYVFARPLYRWCRAESTFIGAFLADLRLGLPGAPVGSDVAWKAWPLVTTLLVLTNVGVYYADVDTWTYAFRTHEPWSWFWGNLTAVFLHADEGHLWGNMIFLWIFGSLLEGRVGRRRLIAYYLLAATAAHALSVLGYMNPESEVWTVGASGAISGLLGLFVIRCHFSRIGLGIPIFGPLGVAAPVMFRVQVNAMLLMMLWFLIDLSGVNDVLAGDSSEVNHWAHVGGYLFGMAVAYGTGLFRDGIREGLALRGTGTSRAENLETAHEARELLLKLEPNHVEALLARARANSRFRLTPEAEADYRRCVEVLLSRDRHRAAEVFAEGFKKYRCLLAPADQVALAPQLAGIGEREVAARALELVAGGPGISPEDRQRALTFEAKLLVEMGLLEAAVRVYGQFLREYPGSPTSAIVRGRLTKLRA